MPDGPWAKYQQQPATAGPWQKYAPAPSDEGVTPGETLLPSQIGQPATPTPVTDIAPETKDPFMKNVAGEGIRFGGSPVTSSRLAEGPTWEEAQKNLLALDKAGVAHDDPRFKEALKQRAMGLQRLQQGDLAWQMVGGGAGGEAAIKAAAPAVEAATGLARRAAKVIPTAQGKFADAAGAALKSDSGKMLDAAIQDAQRTAAPQQAIEAAQAERPGATILEVKQPSPDAAKALSTARQNAQQSAQRLAKAKGDLDLANQNLAAASKYAEANRAARGPSTSATQVRGFQGVKTRAQREFNEAQAAHEEAQTALKEAQTANKQAVSAAKKDTKSVEDEAKRATRKETVSLNQARRDAKASAAITQRLKQLKAELDAPNSTPEQLASSARSIGKVLFDKGHMTFDRYKEFLGQVNQVEKRYEERDKALGHLRTIVKGLELYGIPGIGTGAALGYVARRGGFLP